MNDNEKSEAIERGRRAALDQQSTEMNPYTQGSVEAEAWATGWRSVKAADGNAAPDDT